MLDTNELFPPIYPIIIPICHNGIINLAYIILPSDRKNSLDEVPSYQFGSCKIYKADILTLYKMIKDSDEKEIFLFNMNTVYPLKGITLPIASRIRNLGVYNQINEEWYVGEDSFFKMYYNAAREVGSDHIAIPWFYMKEKAALIIKTANRLIEDDSWTGKVCNRIMIDESSACMALFNNQEDSIRLNSSVDGWSVYGKFDKKVEPDNEDSVIIGFDYSSFQCAVWANLMGDKELLMQENMYDAVGGDKKEFLKAINGNFLIDKSYYGNIPREISSKIFVHKKTILKQYEDTGYVQNYFGYTVSLPQHAKEELYKIYSYYLRSNMSFVMKGAIISLASLINKKWGNKIRVKKVNWDEILVDTPKDLCQDVIKDVSSLMGHPLSNYGINWLFKVRNTRGE